MKLLLVFGLGIATEMAIVCLLKLSEEVAELPV